MAEITVNVQELTTDEKKQRITQCIEALKFAHDNVHKAVLYDDEERYQADLMSLIEDLSLDLLALNASQGKGIAHG